MSYVKNLVWQGVVAWQISQFRTRRPSLVVLPNDNMFPFDRIVQVLNRERIPFLLVQEGIRYELPGLEDGRRYGQGGAVAVAAWGPSSCRYFASVGVSPDRIHVVGNPRLDTILKRDWAASAEQLRATLGVRTPVLLYISSPTDILGFSSAEDKIRQLTQFLALSEPFLRTADVQVVVKVHPLESIGAYAEAARSVAGPERVMVVRDCELYSLFRLSRAAVAVGSTAGLEALVFGLPLGILPVPGVGYLYDFVERKAAVPLELNASLPAQLRLLVTDTDKAQRARQSYLADQVANLGHAASAMEGLIQDLLSAPNVNRRQEGSHRPRPL